MALSWSTVQSALRSWVAAGAGAAYSSKCIWADQDVNRPEGDFITLKVLAIAPAGAVDEVRTFYDGSRALGQEIEHRVIGRRELTVAVQVFTAAKVGSSAARAVASKVQTALSLPSVRDTLRAAGVTPFDPGSVRDVTALLDADYEGRAVLEARFYVSEEVSEFTGYIATVTAEPYWGPPDSGTSGGIDI